MSTKIYNGLKFKTANITTIFNELTKLKPVIIEIG